MNIVKNDEDYKRDIKEKVFSVLRQRGRISADGKRTCAYWRGSTELNIQLNEDTWYDHARGEHKTWGPSYVGFARLLYHAGEWPFEDPRPPRVIKSSIKRRPKSAQKTTTKNTTTSKQVLHWYSEHLRVVRIEKGDGSKMMYPQYKTDGVWHNGLPTHMTQKNAKRPLYNMEQMLTDIHKPVLVVEGEKMVDVLKPQLTDYVVVSWLGGSGTASRIDWSVIADQQREIYLCPDNDDTGRVAMDDIGQRLSQVCPLSRLYVVDTSGIKKDGQLNNGGDLVDLAIEEVADFIVANARGFESDKFAFAYDYPWPIRAAARFGRYMFSEGRGLRYAKETEQWQVWDSPIWRDLPTKTLIGHYINGVFSAQYIYQLTKYDRNECRLYASIHHKGFPQRMLCWLLSYIGVDDFPKPPGYELACAQGIIDLRTGEVRSARMETDNHTLMICGQYDRERTDADTKLTRLIQQWIPDAAELLWLRLALGEAMHGRASDSHHFLCVIGKGGSGKSTFFENLLVGALGSLVKSGINLSDIAEAEEKGRPHNALLAEVIRDDPRLMIADEVGSARLPRNTLKSLSSRGMVSARAPYASVRSVGRVNGLFICIGNEEPHFKTDSGLNRRLRVLRMDNVLSPAQRDPSIQVQLTDPNSGLSRAALRWIVDCARDYWSATEGGIRPLPQPPDSMVRYKQEMLCRVDVIYEVVSRIRVQDGTLIGLTTQDIKDHNITAQKLDDYSIWAIGRWLNSNGYEIKQKRVGAGERRSEVVSEPELSE